MPESAINYMRSKLKIAGIRTDPREIAGGWMFVSFLFGMVSLLLYAILSHGITAPWRLVHIVAALEFFFIGFVVCIVMLQLSTYYAVRGRTSAMEKVLPDFLLLTASNMRAGMTPFTAFVRAARPEFGSLSKEVIYASSQLSGTASLSDALDELSRHFDSMILNRAVGLFKKGVKSGGHIANLLIASAEEIRKISDLRQELIIATRTYSIFLGFIVIIIMPFLLSISTHFIVMFLTIRESTMGASNSITRSIPMFGGSILITPDEMVMLAYLALLVTSSLVSCLVGIITTGRWLDGIKYAPVFSISSIIMFTISKWVIGSMLANML